VPVRRSADGAERKPTFEIGCFRFCPIPAVRFGKIIGAIGKDRDAAGCFDGPFLAMIRLCRTRMIQSLAEWEPSKADWFADSTAPKPKPRGTSSSAYHPTLADRRYHSCPGAAAFDAVSHCLSTQAIRNVGLEDEQRMTIGETTRTYPDFPGKIGRTRADSEPHWRQPIRPPAGSPNIVIVFMDDMGWSDVGCYGSEIDTPNIDALAERGIRFNHYTTHPICSPARAALLTGRNAHSVATGWLANNNPGFPGYFGDIPLDAPTIAETLRAAGYATAAVGKWHNSTNGAAPNPTWPTYRGFNRFYGFLEGETS
jgi:hypothetical protein